MRTAFRGILRELLSYAALLLPTREQSKEIEIQCRNEPAFVPLTALPLIAAGEVKTFLAM